MTKQQQFERISNEQSRGHRSAALADRNDESISAKMHSSLEDAAARRLSRERLQARFTANPLPGLPMEEMQVHFRDMPTRYWDRVTKAELTWALEIIHTFFESWAPAEARKSRVVAQSRYCPERGLTKVMVCAWDQPGLLAKIAAIFSALSITILRADVFTRGDGLALDVFEVRDLGQRHTPNERLSQFVFLLEGALCEPPRFASVWASQFHKILPRPNAMAPKVEFDNDYSTDQTVVRVQASDRLGLLHDLLRAMAEAGLNIAQATVETEHDIACDVFFVTDLGGHKILHPTRLARIQRALVRSILS